MKLTLSGKDFELLFAERRRSVNYLHVVSMCAYLSYMIIIKVQYVNAAFSSALHGIGVIRCTEARGGYCGPRLGLSRKFPKSQKKNGAYSQLSHVELMQALTFLIGNFRWSAQIIEVDRLLILLE